MKQLINTEHAWNSVVVRIACVMPTKKTVCGFLSMTVISINYIVHNFMLFGHKYTLYDNLIWNIAKSLNHENTEGIHVPLLWCFTKLSYGMFRMNVTMVGGCGIFSMHTLMHIFCACVPSDSLLSLDSQSIWVKKNMFVLCQHMLL
jgi:hypothetical protein